MPQDGQTDSLSEPVFFSVNFIYTSFQPPHLDEATAAARAAPPIPRKAGLELSAELSTAPVAQPMHLHGRPSKTQVPLDLCPHPMDYADMLNSSPPWQTKGMAEPRSRYPSST